MVQHFKYSSYVPQQFHLGLAPFVWQLLEFNVFFRISELNQELADSFTMVSLKKYLTVFRCSATCAEAFQFLSHSCKVSVLVVYAIKYCHWSPILSCFKPYANPLLLLLYLATSAQVFGKPACRTNFSHDAQRYSRHSGI
jgi:hypothetical protein